MIMEGKATMKNNNNINIARRLTAILLTLIMVLGTFSMAAFAEDAVTDETVSTESVVTETETPDAEDQQVSLTDDTGDEMQQDAGETPEEAAPQADASDEVTPASEEVPEDAESSDAAADTEAIVTDEQPAQPDDDAAPEGAAAPEAAVRAPAVRAAAEYFVSLPAGVTMTFDGTSRTSDGRSYAVPAGSAVQLSVDTDAAECVFSAVSGGQDILQGGDSFVMPDADVTVGVEYYSYIKVDLASDGVPDGTSVTVNGTAVSAGQKTDIRTKAGDPVSVSVTTGAAEYDLAVTEVKSGNAVAVTDGSFTMPRADVSITGKFYQHFNVDLTGSDVPGGFYVTINGTKISKGEKKAVKVEVNKKISVDEIADLGSDYNYGNDRPSGTVQLKMAVTPGSGSRVIVPLNTFKSDGYQMGASDVDASLYVLYGWKITFTGTMKSCSIVNSSDSSSPWYGHAGDSIRISYDKNACEGPVEITVKDQSGKTVASADVSTGSWTFKMPAGAVNIIVKGELAKKKYNITIRDARNGSLKAGSTKQPEGTTVTVTAVPAAGYAVTATGVMVTYSVNGKSTVIKADVTEKGSNTFTFRMPAADVSIATAFVVPHTVQVATNGGGQVTVDYGNDYGDYSSKGKKVQLRVTPKAGYTLKSWTAVDAGGNEIQIKADGSFTMPDSDVRVGAVFEKESSGGSSGGSGGYSSGGRASYYSGQLAPDYGGEVDENVTPEELIDYIPLVSAVTAKTALGISVGINLMTTP